MDFDDERDGLASTAEDEEGKEDEKTRRIRQLNQIVCICKGIKLAQVLRGMEGAESVEDVNRQAGTGQGGCAGERCGPKIAALLRRKKRLQSGS